MEGEDASSLPFVLYGEGMDPLGRGFLVSMDAQRAAAARMAGKTSFQNILKKKERKNFVLMVLISEQFVVLITDLFLHLWYLADTLSQSAPAQNVGCFVFSMCQA